MYIPFHRSISFHYSMHARTHTHTHTHTYNLLEFLVCSVLCSVLCSLFSVLCSLFRIVATLEKKKKKKEKKKIEKGKKKKKDLQDIQGLISVDRNSKATQPLTIPRPIQVVCKGSSPINRQVWCPRQPTWDLSSQRQPANMVQGARAKRLLMATRLQL